MASDAESWEKMKQWESKSSIELAAMLVRVEGKNRDLCLAAASRIEKLEARLSDLCDGYQVGSKYPT